MYTAAGHPNTSPCPTLTPMQPRSPSSSSFCRMRAGSATCRSPSLKSRRFERRGRVWLQLSLRRPLTASCQSAILRWHPLREDRMEFDRRRREFITLLGGGAVAWPLAARAQQSERIRRVGVLMAVAESDADVRSGVAAFQQSLQELGWKDGRNIRIDYRWGDADAGRIQALAKELVGLQPDVLVAHSTPSAKGLLQATRSIPIVFLTVTDPLGQGLVASLSRPGGNITGFSVFEFL